MSFEYFQFVFSTLTVEPPTGSQIRLDAAYPHETASKLWIRFESMDGFDLYYMLRGIDVGAPIYLQDKNDHTRGALFTVTAAPIDRTDYFEIPVAWVQTLGAAMVNAQAVIFVRGELEDAPDTNLNGPLVSFAAAKAHLKITQSDDDAEIESKRVQASATIRDYLKARNVPEWNETNTPGPVQAATLQLLAHLWEHRGDDFAPDDHDRKLWEAIGRMLERFRDPAFA